MAKMFRFLRPDEIDCRVSTVTEKGCSLLLYKDARVDQNILDETFGMFCWQRSHQLIGDRLYCTVSVRNPETGEWISKQDVGTESYTEAEKGQASDSFKRACFNFGIGRELYTAPFIWIGADKCEIKQGRNGKPTVYEKFKVSEIGYTEGGTINRLVIVNSKKTPVFAFGEKPVDYEAKVEPKQIVQIRMILKRHQMPEKVLMEKYKLKKLEDFTVGNWIDFVKNGEAFFNEWDKTHERQD